MEVTITPKNLNPLYIYGDALNGWEPANFVEMTNTSGTYEFSYDLNFEGDIQNGKQFRFSCQSDNQWPGYVRNGDAIYDNNKYGASYCPSYDGEIPNYWIYVKGTYKVTINVQTNEVTITPTNLSNLYICGSDNAFSLDNKPWDEQNPKELAYDGTSFSYKWEGTLTTSSVGFRFLCKKGAWWPSYAREQDYNDTKAKYHTTDPGNWANFYIGSAGNYTIQLFPLTLEVKITNNDSQQ